MSGQSIALPRAKRRRRKPPHARFWWTLGNLVWTTAFAVFDLMLLITGTADNVALISAFAGLQIAAFIYWWPQFLRELAKWKADNDA